MITASSAMEYAFEGDELTDTRELAPSVFTSALVEGLASGDADRDQDGLVALDELYDYIYDKVRTATPNQTPGKWTFGVQGELVIARRARPVTTPAPLPPELQEAIDSPLAAVRGAAVQELARVLHGRHAGRALAAQLALERLTEDDSRTAAAAASAALSARPQQERPAPEPREPAPPELTVSATVVDFGRLPHHGNAPERRIRLGNSGGGNLNARSATQASWLTLHQAGDELVVTVDTTAAGEHEGTVTVDSDGGSATIRVRARVELAPVAALEAAAAIHREAALIDPEAAWPGIRKEEAVTEAEPAPAPASRPAAETENSPAPSKADRRADSQIWNSRLLLAAGGLAIIGAVLSVVQLFLPYVQGFRGVSRPADLWSAVIAGAVVSCAGIFILMPQTRRLIGPGLLIGTVATAPSGPVTAILIGRYWGDVGPGLPLDITASAVLTIAGCLAVLALARAGDVRVGRWLPEGIFPSLVALLGAAGAAVLIFQVLTEQVLPGAGYALHADRDLLGLIWATAMAFLVPAAAAIVQPREFGVALLAGWIGSGVALVVYYTGVGNSLFGLTLLALLAVIIPFARAAPGRRTATAAADEPSSSV